MNDNKRRTIVWDTIERLAFRPEKPAEWLNVYAKTLHRFWGDGAICSHLAPNGHFFISFLMLKCSYHIESAAKYSASITQTSRCYWQNHIDPAYPSKASLNSGNDQYPRQQKTQLKGDIETVLDGMIFHPRCHTHLEELGIRSIQLDQNTGGLSSHDVRIGGGIENPYVFLFHLRYQFCLVSNIVRQAEKQRLREFFEQSFWDKQKVAARDLFNLSR